MMTLPLVLFFASCSRARFWRSCGFVFRGKLAFALPRDVYVLRILSLYRAKVQNYFRAISFFLAFFCTRCAFMHRKSAKSPQNARFLAFFLAQANKIYDNTKLEGMPSCRKFGLRIVFVFAFNCIFGFCQRSVPSSLYQLKRDSKAGLFPSRIFGSKKAGWYDPATPTATQCVAVGFFYCVKKAAQGGFLCKFGELIASFEFC
ncbi:MAG: hypothetical protein R2912_02275 [Eubacteriales bacterium]